MWWKWLPWRFALRRIAKAHGFLDPLTLLAKMKQFAEPSEVAEPIELLRAGAVMHARGLINSRVIQHNLDWVWPYWVERQFNPLDEAFIPRAFSLTHINLTHRNWTAVGHPADGALAIVDPRGLLTPWFDAWSLDCWLLNREGEYLFPSRCREVQQDLLLEDGWTVRTRLEENARKLTLAVTARPTPQGLLCELQAEALCREDETLVFALRPYNPEGISFIHEVELDKTRCVWLVDGEEAVCFREAVEGHHVSVYKGGDVALHLRDREEQLTGTCPVGLITAAASFQVKAGKTRQISVEIPIKRKARALALSGHPAGSANWDEALRNTCRLQVPDATIQFLFDAAQKTLVLHSCEDIYPGPYTYKRFWFRDAAFILYAMLQSGFTARVEAALDRFPLRQKKNGFFHSQEGEWDSNGEVLWIYEQFSRFTGRPLKPLWMEAVARGARWIIRKRLPVSAPLPVRGLMPSGFSAEHLGPNDNYYWDNFWSLSGLRAAEYLAHLSKDAELETLCHREALDLERAIETSLNAVAARLGYGAVPASPGRRLDAGAIGSLVASYPLKIFAGDDPRLHRTVQFLGRQCLVGGGFFQDMIHSGINAYLTLHMAQVLLRAGDPWFQALVETVAGLASPTGQWPEAIHPKTGGGCMGDGQHVWAAAEWVSMIRHLFVREEGAMLILGSGLFPEWLQNGAVLSFTDTLTAFGPFSVSFQITASHIEVAWEGHFHEADGGPLMEIRLPGRSPVSVVPGQKAWRIPLEENPS